MPVNRQRFSNKNNSDSGRGHPAESDRTAAPSPRGTLPDTPRGTLATPGAQPTERSTRPGSSFEARFGRVILQHGIAAIPSALFHYQGEVGLKAQHVWFISYILSHKWDEDLPYPSLSNMARCSGVTLRNIQFIKSDLCRAGMLQVTDRYNDKGGRESNAYDFSGLFTHLEELIAQDAGDADRPNRIGAALTAEAREGATPDGSPQEADPSFVARFGRVIAKRGVAAVPRAIFTHQKVLGLTPQQVWFVSYIFSFQWSTTLPYPSINKMVQHTGYSRAHLHTIKAELVEAGYLRLVHRTNDQGGQDSNAYDFSGLLDAIRAQLQPDEPLTETEAAAPSQENSRGRHLFAPRRGQGGARQRSGSRSENGSEEVNSSPRQGAYEPQHTGPHEREQTGGYESERIGEYERRQTPPHESGRTGPVRAGSYRGANRRGPGATKRSGHELETDKEEENSKKDDSNQRAPRKDVRTQDATTTLAGGKYSPYIAAVAADFSRELGDTAHEASNLRQALNLWQRSGLAEESFVQLMQEARKLTRRYQSRPTWDAMQNKMAYYFATLRDLLERPGNV
jgi:hypothetical protein